MDETKYFVNSLKLAAERQALLFYKLPIVDAPDKFIRGVWLLLWHMLKSLAKRAR